MAKAKFTGSNPLNMPGIGKALMVTSVTGAATEGTKAAKGALSKNSGISSYDKVLGNKQLIDKQAAINVNNAYKDAYRGSYVASRGNENDKGSNIVPKAIGTALGAVAVADAIRHKNALHPFKVVGREIASVLPRTKTDRSSKIMRSATDKANKIVGSSKSREKGDITRDALGNLVSGASFAGGIGFADSLIKKVKNAEQEKTAGVKMNPDIKRRVGEYIKGTTQEGLKVIPYTVAPLALGYAVDKDLKFDGSSGVRQGFHNNDSNLITVDIPTNQVGTRKGNQLLRQSIKDNTTDKVASAKPWGEFFAKDMPDAAVKGLATSIPLTAITMATKRNIRGRGEKLTTTDSKPLDEGMTRVVISKSAPTPYSSDQGRRLVTTKVANEINTLFEKVGE